MSEKCTVKKMKFINAQQAKPYNNLKKNKQKLLKTNELSNFQLGTG
jgi:hypothetical protein